MNELFNQYYATDKDIFDLLMSGKQRLTESVLRELARDRGIFYSPRDTREELVEKLSLLPHDFEYISGLMHRREHKGRGEKTTHLTLKADLSVEEIKAVVTEYQEDVGATEKVTSYQKGSDGYVANVEYDEIDYSRTRLIQRQRHEAEIRFIKKGDKTVVMFPATEKAQRVVATLKEKVEGKRKSVVPQEIVELTGVSDPEGRTTFFTRLISELKGYRLRDVTNLRVSSGAHEEEGDEEMELGEEKDAIAQHEMLAYVRNMALAGQNLVASDEYQQLRKRGFFITSVTWKAEQTTGSSPDIILFHAEFENGEQGTGFKYAIKGAQRYVDGQHVKTPKPVEEYEREALFSLIHSTSWEILKDLVSKYGSIEVDDEEVVA